MGSTWQSNINVSEHSVVMRGSDLCVVVVVIITVDTSACPIEI